MRKCKNCDALTREQDNYCRNCGVLIASDFNILINSIFTGLILIGIIFFVILFVASYLLE